ncbi:hypothetical protein ABL78_3904 [Leptomonas seymouri]|uniref:Uncharacterized protein n=1 Tax=Leptomonas seymouri TaxID=5684 RepID=A0A0N0P5Z8_LEPSE|nr:hypothetical protein ABL78_3904 [Leptomonas seymouri]|eukprot:KPI87039.1 hypothetical protein ABL78_3904 [Leptomonas seymouri]
MSQPTRQQTTPAEAAAVHAVRGTSPTVALSSVSAPTAPPEDFCEEDRPLLSFIALSAAQCSIARSAEVVLEAVLTLPNGGSPALSHQSSSLTPTTATNPENKSLTERYPEVLLLLHLHSLRCALRDLQECPSHARRTFFSIVAKHLTELSEVLPDPLFRAIATVLKDSLASKTEGALGKERCHTLETQLIRLVEITQVELLRATKLLSVRAGVLTLRFHHDIPYL